MLLKSFLITFSCVIVFGFSRANPFADTILSRYRQYFLRPVSVSGADDFAAAYGFNLTAAKQWSDINYADTSPSYWQTRDHLGRVKMLAVAWVSPASKYYKDQRLWQTISRALDHWLEKPYTNTNWWVNEIGVPQDMRDILVLIHTDLSAGQRSKALEVLAQHKVRGVGANLIWSADLAIHYGALVNDEAMIRQNVELISKEIKVTTEDGIQLDYSYHQHGSRLQIYHYGLSFLETNVRIAWEMHGTPWSFPQDKITILTDYILSGWQWMSRGINIVPGTIDRAASRKDQLHNADLRQLAPYLCDINPAYKTVFTAIAARQNGETGGKPLSGFRYYPYSDFAAYQQPSFSFFLKTISTRTLKSESINTENVKGRLLNNGDGYLISSGNEYYNLLPAWNWNFLPGQTNTNSSTDTIVSMHYSGSVTDQNTGLTAMDYTVNGDGTLIAARKVWACHGNTVVCLISNRQGRSIHDSVFTALDQCRWQTAVEVNQPGTTFNTEGTYPINNVRWIHQANFGYILLQPSAIQLRLSVVTSSWSSINEAATAAPVTEKVFMPLLCNQGKDLSSAGYVLVYATSSEDVQKLAAKPVWQVCKNDTTCQAVKFDDGVMMSAFYAAGSVQVEKGRMLSVDAPCLIQVTNNRLFVSDPLHKGGFVNVRWNNKTYQAHLNSDGTTASIKL